MDPRDLALQAVTPATMVPRFGPFEPLERPGHRFLVAADGMWIEVRRAWLYARVKLANQSVVPMPFGAVVPALEFSCGSVPLDLIQSFSQRARAVCPLETAAWVVWDESSGSFHLIYMHEHEASRAHVRFDRPRLEEGQHLIVDIHSHGRFDAGFSSTDNIDDQGEVKVSMVVGNCDKERLSMATRLCLNGKFIALLPVPTGDRAVSFEEKQDDLRGSRSAA